VTGIRARLDKLDEAFLFEKTIDFDTYERHRDRLREQLTLAQIDRHTGELDELDVEGILAFAERVLPRASDLWIQASLDQRQCLQTLFFPRRHHVRREIVCSNCLNSPRVQLLRGD
jgi:hypothetical protein